MTLESTLRKCSRCQCNIVLAEFFSKNRKGEYNKTCNGCLRRQTVSREESRQKGTGNYDCEYAGCDYKTYRDFQLQRHINSVHLKLKDHRCATCEYTASTYDELNKHTRRIHNGEKAHTCSVCGVGFFTSAHLRRHTKAIHLKIKEFECPNCDVQCNTKYDLRVHMKRCTGNMKCSAGEYAIMTILDRMEFSYNYDSPHELKNETGKWLRWDFIVTTNGDPIFIEYDGRQHHQAVRFGGCSQEKAEEVFRKQQVHDKLKNDYCDENGYLLLRIPYTDFGNIPQILTDFMATNTDWGFE